jgi:ribosomal-protein-serine acetyltransferase
MLGGVPDADHDAAMRIGDLVIRPWCVEDAEVLAEAIADSTEHLRPWMPWIDTEPLPLAERRALVRRWSAEAGPQGDNLFGMFLAGTVVGGCGVHHRSGPGIREIGYWVRRGHTRQGLATAAAGALTTFAFAIPGVDRVEIRHDKANVASAGVPRRLGYTYMGESADPVDAPGEVGINCRWQMTALAWQDRPQ